MDAAYYLPNEQLNYSNYPEIRPQRANIEAVLTYSQTVSTAMTDYETGKYDRIDLNTGEIQDNIDLCRTICGALGNAPKPCIEVLMEVRNVQKQLQNIMYLYGKSGSALIGTPTNTTSEGGGV